MKSSDFEITIKAAPGSSKTTLAHVLSTFLNVNGIKCRVLDVDYDANLWNNNRTLPMSLASLGSKSISIKTIQTKR